MEQMLPDRRGTFIWASFAVALSPFLPPVHSKKDLLPAWPGSSHRQQKINSCCLLRRKVHSHIADSEVAHFVPPQDGVIPTSLSLAGGNRADTISRLVAKPFNLPRHQILQNQMGWKQPVEFPTIDALD